MQVEENIKNLGCAYGQPQRIAKVLSAWIKELCKVKKGLDERIDESVLRWYGHVERMESNSLCR